MKTVRCFQRLVSGLMRLGGGSAAFLLTVFLLPSTASAQSFDIRSENLTVTVTCSPANVQLTHIRGKSGNKDFDYLSGTPSLLMFGSNNSDYNGTFSGVSCNTSGEALNITANSSDGLLAFWISVAPDGAKPVVIVSTQVTYQGPSTGTAAPTAFFRARFPSVQFNVPNSATLPGNAMAMVPQMVGTVVPLANVTKGGLGATYASDGTAVPPSAFGLPTSQNVMEIAEVYDGGGGGGLYFMDLNGDYAKNIAPLQFNLTSAETTSGTVYQITGYWTALLKLNQAGFNQWVTLPNLAIGTHSSGDWHHAVDYYVSKHKPNWTFPSTPSWFRGAAGIYLLGVAGGGSFFNTFPFTAINDKYFGIELFACNSQVTVNGITKTTGTPPNLPGHRCLVDVYNDAQKLGANVLYLTSWWSGGYGNKGDYIVDPDLGGETGLTEAVTEIYSLPNPGYVILYMEPYAAAASSALVSTGPGNTWRSLPRPPIPALNGAGAAIGPTDICAGTGDCMAIPNTQWQDYLINIVIHTDPLEANSINLVKTTGVDGVFLNSWGWQMNWPVGTSSEDVDYTSKEWTAAALRFVDRFRNAIQEANPNAIVMGENNTGQLPFHWDGGSAADLSPWGPTFKEDGGMMLASPIRYAMPNANFFVNGGNLGGLNQVFAAGHNLALGPFWLLDVTTAPATRFAPYGIYTSTRTLTTISGSYSATVVPMAGLAPGFVVAATSVPSDTTVTEVSGTTVTLSQEATETASVSAKFSWPVPHPNSIVSSYISSLMNIRKTYADALVSGTQLPMPATTSPDNIVAYMYQGQTNQIVTIVNYGSTTVGSVTVTLDPHYGTTESWTQILPETSSPVTFTENSTGEVTLTNILPVPTSLSTSTTGSIPQMGLVILQRSCPTLPRTSPYACAAPRTYPMTTEVPLMNETFSFAANGPAPAGNWIDWIVSGTTTAPSGRWTTVQEGYFSGTDYVSASILRVQSPNDRSLLFYDNFGGGLYFDYSGQVTIKSFAPGKTGGAGLSFRLSDNQVKPPDAGNQGYDLVLTNKPMGTDTGSVTMYKRQPRPGGGTPMLTPLQSAAYPVSAGQTYQLSVSTFTTWTNSVPSYPFSTTFTVSVDGVRQFQVSDASYFSGRFGVNGFNADAHFACLQANGQGLTDGSMPLACPIPPPPTTRPSYQKCTGPLPSGYYTCM